MPNAGVQAEAIYGKTETPSAVFDKARSEATTSAPMPGGNRPQLSGFACPAFVDGVACGKHILVIPGRPGYHCQSGNPQHVWLGREEFEAMNPGKIAIPPPPQAQQFNHKKIEFELPMRIYDALKARFGDKLPATLAATVRTLAEGPSFTVSQEDKERLEKQLGQPIVNAGVLVGLIFALVQQRTSLQEQVTNYESQTDKGATSGIGLNVPLSAEMRDKLAERAKANEKNPSQFAAWVIEQSIVNGWF